MKAIGFGLVALMLTVSACEKRKGMLMPPRDSAHKADAGDRQELRARSLPEGALENEIDEAAPLPMNDEEKKDLQLVKQDAIQRITKNPATKFTGNAAARKKAAALYQRGRQLMAQGNFDEGQEYYLVACQLGHPAGCHKFGWYLERAGNYSNAQQFYKIACEDGMSKSCNNLGFRFEKQRHWDEALDFYARACLEKHSVGCENLKRLRQERLKAR